MNVDIENLLDLLRDIELDSTSEVLEEGVNSLDYRVLVSTLAQNLSYFINQSLSISTTDIPTFVRDLQSALSLLDYAYPIDLESLKSHVKLDLIHFLISELQSAIMIFCREATMPSIPTDLDKPRDTVSIRYFLHRLVALIGNSSNTSVNKETLHSCLLYFNNVLKELPSDYLDQPILNDVNFTIEQQKLIQEMNEMLSLDYKQRKQVLLKRLDVTLHSFLWSIKGEENRNAIISIIQQKRSLMIQDPDVTIYDMLVARMSNFDSIATKTGSVTTSSTLNLKRLLIGQVPDRGGRVNDRRGGEMPGFQARDAVKPQREQTANKGKGRVQGGWHSKDESSEGKGRNTWKRQKGSGKNN